MKHTKRHLDQLEDLLTVSIPLKKAIMDAIEAIQARGEDPISIFRQLANRQDRLAGHVDYTRLTDDELTAIILAGDDERIGNMSNRQFEAYLSVLRKRYHAAKARQQ